MSDNFLLELTGDIVVSHLSNNSVAVGDVPTLIRNVHDSLKGLGQVAAEPEPELKPAVSIRSSVKPDYIICLEDGKKLKMLKRHLMTQYQMTPSDYRAKWGLPAEYPMVAPNYAEQRKALALKIGLGRKASPELSKKPTARKRAASSSKASAE